MIDAFFYYKFKILVIYNFVIIKDFKQMPVYLIEKYLYDLKIKC